MTTSVERRSRWLAAVAGTVMVAIAGIAAAAGAASGLLTVPFSGDSTSPGTGGVVLLLLAGVLLIAAPFVVAKLSGAPPLKTGVGAVVVAAAVYAAAQGIGGRASWADVVALALGIGAMGVVALRPLPGTIAARIAAVAACALGGALVLSQHPEYVVFAVLPAIALADELAAR